jgi:hypothetical protein
MLKKIEYFYTHPSGKTILIDKIKNNKQVRRHRFVSI